ncbi:MAG TPA: hypothetical protein VEK80_14510 [Kribbellaceae bacterium]|nr:hypothetical protein [Kribbellaceae bacterium]
MTKTWRAAAALTLVLVMAGCSGGGTDDDNGAGSTSGDSSPAAGDMAVKFAQCMREHGVQVADPQPGQPLQIQGNPDDASKIKAAQEACKEYAPQGEGNGQQSGDDLDRQAKLVECLRGKGVDVEDPQPGQPLRIRGQRQNEAKTNQAMQECQAEVGGPTPQRVGG